MTLFLPFTDMPQDWPTSVIPLDPRGLFFVGDLTHGGARRIVAFVCASDDRWIQPWAATAPVPGARVSWAPPLPPPPTTP